MLAARLDGVEEVTLLLARVEDRSTDLTSAWSKVGQWYGQRSAQAFVKGAATWAPLATSYWKRKRRAGLAGRGTGVRSGMLRQHATESEPDVSTPQYAIFGLTRADPVHLVERGAYLKKGRPSMRARNVVPALTGAEKRQVLTIVRDHILKE